MSSLLSVNLFSPIFLALFQVCLSKLLLPSKVNMYVSSTQNLMILLPKYSKESRKNFFKEESSSGPSSLSFSLFIRWVNQIPTESRAYDPVFRIRKQENCLLQYICKKPVKHSKIPAVHWQKDRFQFYFRFKNNLSRAPVPSTHAAAHFLALLQYAREKKKEQRTSGRKII